MEQELKWIRRIQKRQSKKDAEQLIRKYYDEIYVYVYRQTGNKDDSMDLTQAKIALSFLQMLGISLSALFLYGTATLVILSRTKNRYQWILPAAWCGVCIAPVVLHINILGFLMGIPGVAALIAAILTLLLFFAELEHYVSTIFRGGMYHAVD